MLRLVVTRVYQVSLCLFLTFSGFAAFAAAQAPRFVHPYKAGDSAVSARVQATSAACSSIKRDDTPNFGVVSLGQANLWCSTISIPQGGRLTEAGVVLSSSLKSVDDPGSVFKYVLTGTCDNSEPSKDKTGDASGSTPATPQNKSTTKDCYLSIGYSPLTANETKATLVITIVGGTAPAPYTLFLDGAGAMPSVSANCQPPKAHVFPASHGYPSPNSFSGVPNKPTGEKLYSYLGVREKMRSSAVNCYYATNDAVSFFNQVQSVYNGASTSAAVTADLASLNFINGMQLTLGTNILAGPGAPATAVVKGTSATLSATSAAQAAQDMQYGGTIFVSDMLPIFTYSDGSPGGLTASVGLVAKEGVDLQNFTSGTNTSLTSPSSHFSSQIQGYLEYNSTNLNAATNGIAGSIFIAGSYGYSYTSHGFARTFGLSPGTGVNSGIGQISAGVNASGVAKIAISRGFGPSQSYYDSATASQVPSPGPVTVNNFKSWSFGITYQPKPSSN